MAFVVAATWRAKEGEEGRISQAIAALTPLSQGEPGCILYQPHRSPDDPRAFFIYEQYTDRAAFDEHRGSVHFQRYVRDEIIPYLETRDGKFYETIDV
jgi:quinol monooxygenase YgiN